MYTIFLYKYIYSKYILSYKYRCIYGGCSKFFHVENAIFAKKNTFAKL